MASENSVPFVHTFVKQSRLTGKWYWERGEERGGPFEEYHHAAIDANRQKRLREEPVGADNDNSASRDTA